MIQNDTIAPTAISMCGLQAAKYNQAAADIVLYDDRKCCTWVLVSFKTSVLLVCSSHLTKVNCYIYVATGI